MRKIFGTVLLATALSACSTTGGVYDRDDAKNDQFSVGNTLLGILAIAGAVAIASTGGAGGGAGYSNSFGPVDYDWAWDEFYGEHYRLVWACRGKQTGQFAELEKCTYKPRIDTTWPAKRLQ